MSDDLRNALKKLLSEPPNILNKEDRKSVV